MTGGGRGSTRGDRARTSRRRKKTKKRAEGTVAATRGGDLWWDYRWRYFFITVSPGRLSLFSSSSHSGRPLRPFGDVLSCLRLAPAGSHRKKLLRLLRHCLYLPTSVTYTPPRARSARGGLYLNNIHELRYTRQIYCPGTRGFYEDLRTDPSAPSLCVPPFLRSSVLRVPLPSFFSSSRSPSVSWPPRFYPPYRRT